MNTLKTVFELISYLLILLADSKIKGRPAIPFEKLNNTLTGKIIFKNTELRTRLVIVQS